MSDTLDYMKMFAGLPFALPHFLRHGLTLEKARCIVRERMEHREDNFLHLVESSIYGNARSPYLPLLKLAGCELGDLRAMVKHKGLEGTLRELRAAGVYVTFEEFKGRIPIVRGGQTIPVAASDFDTPRMRRNFTLQTGGSSGAAMNVGIDLEHIAERAADEMVAVEAYGLLAAPVVRWNGPLPAGTLRNILCDSLFGITPERWFSPIGLRASNSWIKYALATYYTLFWLRLYGKRVPWPEYVGVERSLVVARALAEIIQKHGQCLLRTSVSRALRVCLAAQQAGIDLRGTIIAGSSEAPTPAKVQRMESAGVRFFANYATVEASRIGSACANPADASDVHLHQDVFALFTFPYYLDDLNLSVPAFNLTSLLSAAPKVMLNVQMDDYGIVEERQCGCALEGYGLTTHLREIRSYSKLTGEGVTLIGNEILRILEEVLPARFGGSPLDYQLVEEEEQGGLTRLYLIISPRIEIADEHQVIQVMLNAMRNSSPMADAARTVWQQTQTIQVKRAEPVRTVRGKLLPLHIANRR